MIYMNQCHNCGKEWPCTKPKAKCLKCTEKDGEVYR